ncbi:methyltransferase domain-containing protein [Actinomadura formosensis]|uniref:methyltransferase domain-containing protein n=1 Tax=Actinomadura formosensis TaxID=60706 RepID=UPI003D93103C
MTFDDWRDWAAALADRLCEQGVITDPAWREVVTSVPRHMFVPEFHDDTFGLVGTGDPRWPELVYSDDTLVTQRKEHPDQPGFQWSTSSSTRPSLMLRMLHLLDVRHGMNVLEIGTGTGYNAALLCERLGSEHVTTVDIDPELTGAARARLAGAGYSPTVVTRDGVRGYAERAPYDRVITTVATERVPYTWVEQTRRGGIVLADVRPPGMTWAGALTRLTVAEDGTASGPLHTCTWGFMSARADVARPGIPQAFGIDATNTRSRTSEVGAESVHISGLSLLIWWCLDDITVFPGPDEIQISTADGSWAKVSKALPARVEHGGPSDIWAEVEHAHAWWTARGRPGVAVFGLTVTPEGQRFWLEAPDGETVPGPRLR